MSGRPDAQATPQDSAPAGPLPPLGDAAATQRLDKWLWYARFFKTRSLAAKFVAQGKIRLRLEEADESQGAQKVTKASQIVKVGDWLSFPWNDVVHVVRVRAPGTRRGPAPEARLLYDLVNEEEIAAVRAERRAEAQAAPQTQGARPTKKERRAMDRFRDRLMD